MKKAVIFDLGRVLFDYDEMQLTSYYVSSREECEKVSRVVFDRLYWDRLDRGTITDEEVYAEIDRRLPEELAEKGKKAYRNWPYHLPEIPGIRKLVTELHEEGVPLYVLSNISIFFAEEYEKVPEVSSLLSLFDGRVFSGPVHMVKPEPEIFLHLCRLYRLNPADCVFIDDNPANIRAAQQLGFSVWQFRNDVTELRTYLAGFLKEK